MNTGVPAGQVAVNVNGEPVQLTKLPVFVPTVVGPCGCVADTTYVATAEQDVPNEATVRLTTPDCVTVSAEV